MQMHQLPEHMRDLAVAACNQGRRALIAPKRRVVGKPPLIA
jgi:hypothetical protein